MTKKGKTSGAGGPQVVLAINQLQSLSNTIVDEEVDVSDPPLDSEDNLYQRVQDLVEILTYRPHNRSNPPLSATEIIRSKFGIVEAGNLICHSDSHIKVKVNKFRSNGSDQLWSDDNFYKHLSFLLTTLRMGSQASSRMLIDTFLLRASAMADIPSDHIVVLPELPIPAVSSLSMSSDTISGALDYAAAYGKDYLRTSVLRNSISALSNTNTRGPDITPSNVALFVTEAESTDGKNLLGHLPQALLQLFACGKHFEERHVRGALTDGEDWIFIVMQLHENGAKYWLTMKPISWKWTSYTTTERTNTEIEQNSEWADPAVITSIISSWITSSFVEFKGDDWFHLVHAKF